MYKYWFLIVLSGICSYRDTDWLQKITTIRSICVDNFLCELSSAAVSLLKNTRAEYVGKL